MGHKIETFKIHQNNQGFLLGVFKMSELRRFIKFTRRIVIDYDEETNFPVYNEDVQRKISPTKVDGIADFLIYDNDSFFPTNIVVSVPIIAVEDIIEQSEKQTDIILKDFVTTETLREGGHTYLTIIDGQHRLAGIEKAINRVQDEISGLEYMIRTSSGSTEKYESELKKQNALLKRLEDFEIIVSFFIDPTLDYQAMVFSTINRTQTKVPEDLVYSLFGLSKSDSPQKTALEIILALNASEKSPLFNRVKISGAKYKVKSVPPLSQAMAVKSILFQISPNIKKAEIEKNKTRTELKKINHSDFLPFRKYYITGEDAKIAKIINVFFKAVNGALKDRAGNSYWSFESNFNILHTTIGFKALFDILIEILKRTNNEESRSDYAYYESILVKASSIDFYDNSEPKQFPLTSKSVNLLFNRIGEKIFDDFAPRREKN